MGTRADPLHRRSAAVVTTGPGAAERVEIEPARSVGSFEDLRRTEFTRLDARGEAYLDYTGSALYLESHLQWHLELLRQQVVGNPHAESSASRLACGWAEAARSSILEFLDADAADYEAVFTANATAAAKLVGESFPFRRRSRLVLSADNHNSVLGIRQFARAAGASVSYVPLRDDLRLTDLRAVLPGQAPDRSLLAFPAQSNFSGVRHPLALARLAQSFGYRVLLDAAALLPSSALSLRHVPADFVILSLYKVVGYPTGVGALVARRDALAMLRRPWFAGGTVEFSSVQNAMHELRAGGAGFEDGTPNFLALSAVPWGLAFLRRLGMSRVADHVSQLTAKLLAGLAALRHRDGRPLATLYGPPTSEQRGGTVAFNLADERGRWIPHREVEARAAQRRISLRSGCFCNPGAAERAFGFNAYHAALCANQGKRRGEGVPFSIDHFARCMGSVPVGAVRASVGLATNTEDIERLLGALEDWCA